MSDFFHPKLQAVEALAPYRLRTTWSTGEVLDVDVEAVLREVSHQISVLFETYDVLLKTNSYTGGLT